MLWMASLSSKCSSHTDMSLHASGSKSLCSCINRRSFILLGTTSATKASGCQTGATAGDFTWLARTQSCLMRAVVWRT